MGRQEQGCLIGQLRSSLTVSIHSGASRSRLGDEWFRCWPVDSRGTSSESGHLLPVVITLALAVFLIATLASTYFGHSRSPYDTCYGTNGRAVPCSVVEAVH